MPLASRWTPEYLAEVADQIVWTYQSIWNRFTEVDPSLSLERLRQLYTAVRSHRAAAGQIEELYREVQRFRQTGARVFNRPSDLPDQILCTCAFPFLWRGIPDASEVPAEEVEALHFGDMPVSSPDWTQRGQIARFPKLLVLAMFHSHLAEASFDVDLGALPCLRTLDLRENGLEAIPDEVLDCRTLEFLDLRDNPLRRLPDLAALQSLRWLGLARTGLPPGAIEAARNQLDQCEVAAS